MKSLVSVIIPSYNSQDTLLVTIDQLLKQSYVNLEIIIIDDGSTDNSKALFPNFESKGIKCLGLETNQGAANARNKGLEIAQGDYVQFLDADDLLHPQKIEEQLSFMKDQNLELSFCEWSKFEESPDHDEPYIFKDLSVPTFQSGKSLLKSFAMQNWYIPIFCWLCSTRLLKKAGLWDIELTYNDDGEYFSRVIYNTTKVGYFPKLYGYYKQHGSISLSTFNNESKLNSGYKSYRKIEDFLRSNNEHDLLSYPKRGYYILFRNSVKMYPEIAKKSADSFDRIKTPCYLKRKRLFWSCISVFGLRKGIDVYNFIRGMKNRIINIIK